MDPAQLKALLARYTPPSIAPQREPVSTSVESAPSTSTPALPSTATSIPTSAPIPISVPTQNQSIEQRDSRQEMVPRRSVVIVDSPVEEPRSALVGVRDLGVQTVPYLDEDGATVQRLHQGLEYVKAQVSCLHSEVLRLFLELNQKVDDAIRLQKKSD
ncbi:hypothetical protein GMRT_14226 [Giardia muris]|uniref:Uncharacterized protein n=1 Tax=Giardia muris TaxID=5742 RepID=A0A4Z1SZR3_GIAMU|nr:hypothetical protein GMRT_14226 [Giardia muris]|eukprot:TNJ30235.1 hypothetical protein GMRT_14226 [Giardia muris]